MKKEGKIDRRRRQFLWQLTGIAGLTGLGRLAKAMAQTIQPLHRIADEECVDPELPITCNHPANYDCVDPGHNCTDNVGFYCTNDFDCGSWLNDFICEDRFHCTGGFDCQGGGRGPEFTCRGGSNEPDGYFICNPYGQFDCSDFYCQQEFTCPNYNCGDAFSDYNCQAQFTCNDFNCEAVGEWGASFYCENGFNCTSQTQQPFWCDPGDFYCGPDNNQVGYQCNGQPGAQYTWPVQPV